MEKHMNKQQVGSYPEDSIYNKKHKDHDKPGFLVRAVRTGYYGVVQRHPGDVFRIDFARHFADVNDPDPVRREYGWMERANESTPRGRKVSAAERVAQGARQAHSDPDGVIRAQKMDEVDKMAKEAMEIDQLRAEEADVI